MSQIAGHDVSPTLGPDECGRGFSAKCTLTPRSLLIRLPLGSPCVMSQHCTLCNAHSLCYNFTVDPQPSPGEPWCVVQGQVDGNVFLSYDCGGAMIQSTSPLGEEVKTMNTWEIQTETLRDIGDFLKGQMPDIILEKHTAREAELFLFLGGCGPLTLQVRMTCQCEENGHISGSWQFSFNGQMCLLFDSENGRWIVTHSGWGHMKEKWENDRVVTDFLKRVSMGDCWAWLQDFMGVTPTLFAASPNMGPSAVQPRSTAILLTTGITAGVPASFGLFLFCRRRCSQEAPDRCSFCLRTQSLLGCFSSPAVHFRAKKSELRNPKSVYQL
ncbi:hypothetical protein FD755_007373 [Muntiacus reevesi]|uniref:MHC class I-like antigen recognition-like domain-containing protein n=1 Tax=Muntiacus reevesi TaxID=9886 RepID=A0A5J5MHF6_MUNRE|nr:hypothetical protein FD755_007373 [Muntiacus reevesi]